MDAAETGHLVFTTLHANSSCSSLTRLLDMEVPKYKLNASVRGVLAQRLLRKVCTGCAVKRPISENDAIEYTCSCLDGASNCVKLGWDDGWYNPFDYYGEAWYAFNPPNYQSIEEIRVTVIGGQCDALPVWSENYMGMRDDSGNWSQDYELSIDYTSNVFVVSEIWSNGFLMPQIGSEDNYVIDKKVLLQEVQ